MNYTVPALDADIDAARFTFETNFFAVVRITQVFIPLLIEAKGLIINIGSVAAVCLLFFPLPPPLSFSSRRRLTKQ